MGGLLVIGSGAGAKRSDRPAGDHAKAAGSRASFAAALVAAVVAGFVAGFAPRVLAFAAGQRLGVGMIFLLGVMYAVLVGAVAVLQTWIFKN